MVPKYQIKTITSSLPSANDPDCPAFEITYTVSVFPSDGSLKRGATALSPGDNTFTQADIDAGHLSYDNIGTTNDPDSFTFTISDGPGSSIGPYDFIITIDASEVIDWKLIE